MDARERERDRERQRGRRSKKKKKEKQKGMCRCLRDEYRRRGADKDKKKARGPESSGAGAWGDCSLRCAPSYPLFSLSLFLFSRSFSCARARCLVLFASVPQSSPPTRVLRCSKFPSSVFLGGGGEGPNFAKFRPEKYDFDLYKGFFIARFQRFFF